MINGVSTGTGAITLPQLISLVAPTDRIDCSQSGDMRAAWQLGSPWQDHGVLCHGLSNWSAIVRNSRPIISMPIPQSVN
jgi:hypothetical protein